MTREKKMGKITRVDRVLDFLFLSNEKSASNLQYLQSFEIQVIVNVTKEAKIYHPEKFEYFRLAIADNAQTNILSHIDEVVDRIESARLKNQNVLVHCVAGMSRSTSMVIAYLVKYQGMTLRQAYLLVKEKRPITRPNLGFWEQLIQYEINITGVSTVKFEETLRGIMPDVYPKKH